MVNDGWLKVPELVGLHLGWDQMRVISGEYLTCVELRGVRGSAVVVIPDEMLIDVKAPVWEYVVAEADKQAPRG